MQAGFVAAAVSIYQWPDSCGAQLLAVSVSLWLAAFIWFWRIPSTD